MPSRIEGRPTVTAQVVFGGVGKALPVPLAEVDDDGLTILRRVAAWAEEMQSWGFHVCISGDLGLVLTQTRDTLTLDEAFARIAARPRKVDRPVIGPATSRPRRVDR